MILVSFSLQRDAPLGAPVGCSPRASEGFEEAFRGSIKKPCLSEFPSRLRAQVTMLLCHLPNRLLDRIRLTLESQHPAPE